MAEREYNDEYPTCGHTYVTVTFYHPEADPDEVTRTLDVEPSEAWPSRERKLVDGIWHAGRPNGWSYTSDGHVDSRDFRRHLDFVLAMFEGWDEAVDALQSLGWDGSIGVYWGSRSGHGGPMLWPEQAARIGELDFQVWFDIYFEGDDEEDIDEPLAQGELTSSFVRLQRHWRRFGIPRHKHRGE